MRNLLIVATAVEIAVFIGALALYIHWIAASLRRTSASLAKVTFGVRAIETQAAPIGPGVTKINDQLATIAGALEGVAGLAEQAGAAAGPEAGVPRPPRRGRQP